MPRGVGQALAHRPHQVVAVGGQADAGDRPGRERVDERGALTGGRQVGQDVEAVGPGRAGAQQPLDRADLDTEDAQHPVQRRGADHGRHRPQPLAGLAGGHAEPGGVAGGDQLVAVHQAAQRGAHDEQGVALRARASPRRTRSRRRGSRTAPRSPGYRRAARAAPRPRRAARRPAPGPRSGPAASAGRVSPVSSSTRSL